jgi:hypothetical protein
MAANGTQTAASRAPSAHHIAPKQDVAKGPPVGSVVRFVLESDGEHEPTIRAALVLSSDGPKPNLGVLLDGEGDYRHVEQGNSQMSAAVREGALLTVLRRVGVQHDPDGLRAGTWHRAKE